MKRSPDDWAGGAFGLVLLAVLLAIAATVALQIITWLQIGVWPSYPISKMLIEMGGSPPVVSWTGAQKIIDVIMGWPAVLAMAAVGLVAAFCASYLVQGLFSAIARIFSPLPPKQP